MVAYAIAILSSSWLEEPIIFSGVYPSLYSHGSPSSLTNIGHGHVIQ